jgi:hypothetical protein
MIKTKTIEYRICDFCLKGGREVQAIDQVNPSGLDVCEKHQLAFLKQVKLPEGFGKEMSEKKVAIDPEYEAQMVIKYKKTSELTKES